MGMEAGTRRMKSREARALWEFDRRLAGSVGHQNRNKNITLQTRDPLTQQPGLEWDNPFSIAFLSLARVGAKCVHVFEPNRVRGLSPAATSLITHHNPHTPTNWHDCACFA